MAGKTIKGVEIFSAGTWNSDVWTVPDLEKIVANFKAVQAIHKAPLKFGHAENQKFMGQKDGAPALGWVSDLRIEGIKLVADFSDVATRVWDLIAAGRYKRVSAEIYEDVKLDGKPIGPVLRAVALLGADIPAVSNLEEIHVAMMTDALKYTRIKEFTTDNPTYKVKPMADEKTVSVAEFEALKGQLKTFTDKMTAQDDELKKYKEREEKKDLEAKVLKFIAARSGIMAKANELVVAGKLTPALRDELEAKVEIQRLKYSDEDGLSIPAEWALKLFAEVAATKLIKGDKSVQTFRDNPLNKKAGEGDEDVKKDPGEELSLKAKQLLASNPTGFGTDPAMKYGLALKSAMELNPDLAKAYVEQVQDVTLRGGYSESELASMRKGG